MNNQFDPIIQNRDANRSTNKYSKLIIPALFLLCRFILFISLPLEGLRGYGDFVHFFRLAGMGWPFLDYWVEFPPIFPFFSTILFHLVNGKEYVYDYLLVSILTVFQAGSIYIYTSISQKIHSISASERMSWGYMIILLVLPYGWWYFDVITVFFLLLGLLWFLKGKDFAGSVAIALGILVKLFPILALPSLWRYIRVGKAIKCTILIAGIVLFVYGILYKASPEMTIASIRSQATKGSWETVWALLDGNFNTGNFGAESERYIPGKALLPQGNPPIIPSWLTMIVFVAIGLVIYIKSNISCERQLISFIGLTFTIYYLWSPGWSPQWVLYLIPIILLGLPEGISWLLVFSIILVNILEWPVLLSRGYDWGLWITIILRTFLFIVLAFLFTREYISLSSKNRINQNG